jgi:hypothetical protein
LTAACRPCTHGCAAHLRAAHTQIDLRSSEECRDDGHSLAFEGVSFCRYKRDPAVNRVSRGAGWRLRVQQHSCLYVSHVAAGALCCAAVQTGVRVGLSSVCGSA